jgi:hypothetical protein
MNAPAINAARCGSAFFAREGEFCPGGDGKSDGKKLKIHHIIAQGYD